MGRGYDAPARDGLRELVESLGSGLIRNKPGNLCLHIELVSGAPQQIG
jgi:hypothetical protein